MQAPRPFLIPPSDVAIQPEAPVSEPPGRGSEDAEFSVPAGIWLATNLSRVGSGLNTSGVTGAKAAVAAPAPSAASSSPHAHLLHAGSVDPGSVSSAASSPLRTGQAPQVPASRRLAAMVEELQASEAVRRPYSEEVRRQIMEELYKDEDQKRRSTAIKARGKLARLAKEEQDRGKKVAHNAVFLSPSRDGLPKTRAQLAEAIPWTEIPEIPEDKLVRRRVPGTLLPPNDAGDEAGEAQEVRAAGASPGRSLPTPQQFALEQDREAARERSVRFSRWAEANPAAAASLAASRAFEAVVAAKAGAAAGLGGTRAAAGASAGQPPTKEAGGADAPESVAAGASGGRDAASSGGVQHSNRQSSPKASASAVSVTLTGSAGPGVSLAASEAGVDQASQRHGNAGAGPAGAASPAGQTASRQSSSRSHQPAYPQAYTEFLEVTPAQAMSSFYDSGKPPRPSAAFLSPSRSESVPQLTQKLGSESEVRTWGKSGKGPLRDADDLPFRVTNSQVAEYTRCTLSRGSSRVSKQFSGQKTSPRKPSTPNDDGPRRVLAGRFLDTPGQTIDDRSEVPRVVLDQTLAKARADLVLAATRPELAVDLRPAKQALQEMSPAPILAVQRGANFPRAYTPSSPVSVSRRVRDEMDDSGVIARSPLRSQGASGAKEPRAEPGASTPTRQASPMRKSATASAAERFPRALPVTPRGTSQTGRPAVGVRLTTTGRISEMPEGLQPRTDFSLTGSPRRRPQGSAASRRPVGPGATPRPSSQGAIRPRDASRYSYTRDPRTSSPWRTWNAYGSEDKSVARPVSGQAAPPAPKPSAPDSYLCYEQKRREKERKVRAIVSGDPRAAAGVAGFLPRPVGPGRRAASCLSAPTNRSGVSAKASANAVAGAAATQPFYVYPTAPSRAGGIDILKENTRLMRGEEVADPKLVALLRQKHIRGPPSQKARPKTCDHALRSSAPMSQGSRKTLPGEAPDFDLRRPHPRPSGRTYANMPARDSRGYGRTQALSAEAQAHTATSGRDGGAGGARSARGSAGGDQVPSALGRLLFTTDGAPLSRTLLSQVSNKITSEVRPVRARSGPLRPSDAESQPRFEISPQNDKKRWNTSPLRGTYASVRDLRPNASEHVPSLAKQLPRSATAGAFRTDPLASFLDRPASLAEIAAQGGSDFPTAGQWRKVGGDGVTTAELMEETTRITEKERRVYAMTHPSVPLAGRMARTGRNSIQGRMTAAETTNLSVPITSILVPDGETGRFSPAVKTNFFDYEAMIDSRGAFEYTRPRLVAHRIPDGSPDRSRLASEGAVGLLNAGEQAARPFYDRTHISDVYPDANSVPDFSYQDKRRAPRKDVFDLRYDVRYDQVESKSPSLVDMGRQPNRFQ